MNVTGPRHALGRSERPDPNAPKAEQLRQTATQLNSVFVQQMFTAMRNTVSQDEGIMSGGQGEDMFRGMLDQQVAEMAPTQWQKNGALTDAIVRQLGRNLK